jgi:hypothetical protein
MSCRSFPFVMGLLRKHVAELQLSDRTCTSRWSNVRSRLSAEAVPSFSEPMIVRLRLGRLGNEPCEQHWFSIVVPLSQIARYGVWLQCGLTVNTVSSEPRYIGTLSIGLVFPVDLTQLSRPPISVVRSPHHSYHKSRHNAISEKCPPLANPQPCDGLKAAQLLAQRPPAASHAAFRLSD